MTKRIPVRKNMTGNCEQDAEESSASEGKRKTVGKPTGKETVGKPTGKTPGTQNVWDVTETVTEKRIDGRNSTKYMGTSPVMPVTRKT